MGYKYLYGESKVGGILTYPNHRALIDKHVSEGWRFVSAIPSAFYGNNGQPKTFDLVFEKCDDE